MKKQDKEKSVKERSYKAFFLTSLIVFLTVVLSFAEAREPLRKELDSLSRIHGGFSFAVLGDNQSGDSAYREVIKRMMEHKPCFVVNTGDMVSSAGAASWAAFWKDSALISVPYFLTAGNHDVRDEKSEELCREQVGPPGNELYYSFLAGNSLFIILDSEIPGQDRRITGEQYKWLEEVLSASTQEHKFVFVHHPLYPDKRIGRHYGGCLDKHTEERDRLQKLFARYKVTIVFAGHEHLYLRKVIDGVTEIITGGGGAALYAGNEKGGFHHFLLVTADGYTG